MHNRQVWSFLRIDAGGRSAEFCLVLSKVVFLIFIDLSLLVLIKAKFN